MNASTIDACSTVQRLILVLLKKGFLKGLKQTINYPPLNQQEHPDYAPLFQFLSLHIQFWIGLLSNMTKRTGCGQIFWHSMSIPYNIMSPFSCAAVSLILSSLWFCLPLHCASSIKEPCFVSAKTNTKQEECGLLIWPLLWMKRNKCWLVDAL